MEVDWSNLLPELIEIISRKLTNYVDYVRFRAVCVNWRSNLSPITEYFQFPWLMIPSENRCFGFFSPLENKIVHQLNIPNTHPAAQAHCYGASQGWLLFIEERSPNLFLFNPLTCIQIYLPPLTTFSYVLDFNILNVGKEYLFQTRYESEPCWIGLNRLHDRCAIRRFSLSSKNPSEDYTIVAIIGSEQELAFCKKGDEKWTMMKVARSYYNYYHRYQDVIYYKGLFYVVDDRGYVTICDFSSSSPLETVIEPDSSSTHFRNDNYASILYLVADSFGELLLVNRFLNDDDNDDNFYQTEGFQVFRLDTSKPKWVKVESLGDCMLFLGINSTLCLSANDFPAAECQGNCIYFTRGGMSDMGVFNVGNGSINRALSCCSTGSDQILLPPPLLWLTPNPC